ncbi:MAG: Rieske (2Fe-2S) protein [Acidobacteria bacterium]|nr:Rieske (2Fe-2S) protein [Acidobacteriota bacterium]
MAELICIGSLRDMPGEDEAREFIVAGRVICVANVGGRLRALDNVCLHRGGPLGQGVISAGKVVCPWHGWEFDANTGAAMQNPSACVAVYPIRIEGEEVLVEI